MPPRLAWRRTDLPPREPKPRWWIRVDWPEFGPAADQEEPVAQVEDFLVPRQFGVTVVRDDLLVDASLEHFTDEWPRIAMTIEIEHGRPVIRQLTITEPPARDPLAPKRVFGELSGRDEDEVPPARRAINAALLRELPLARLVKHAMLGVAIRLADGQTAEPVVSDDIRDLFGFYRIGPGEATDEYGLYTIDAPAWRELWSEHMDSLSAYVDRASKKPRRNRISDDLLTHVAAVYRDAIQNGRAPKKAVRATFNVSEATAGRYIMQARERGHLGTTRPGQKGENRE